MGKTALILNVIGIALSIIAVIIYAKLAPLLTQLKG
jgi:hypothetical protein